MLWIGIVFANPDPDQTFHFDADPDPGSDPDTSSLKIRIFSIHSNASLHCFIFLISDIGDIILVFFWQHIEIIWKKVYRVVNLYILVETDTDPDPAKMMPTRPDPTQFFDKN